MTDPTKDQTRVIAISSDSLGRGDEELGKVVMRTYLHTLTELDPRPDTIVFFNGGVRLAVDDSPALDYLQAIAGRGTGLLLCGTCVNAFGLADRIGVGEISNMYAISEIMLHATTVINF